jgi:hypothetical protein
VFIEDLSCYPVIFAEQSEEEVLTSDVVMTELDGLQDAHLEHSLGARGHRDVGGDLAVPSADEGDHLFPHDFEVDSQRDEGSGRLGGNARDHPEEEVLGPDVVVVEPA